MVKVHLVGQHLSKRINIFYFRNLYVIVFSYKKFQTGLFTLLMRQSHFNVCLSDRSHSEFKILKTLVSVEPSHPDSQTSSS